MSAFLRRPRWNLLVVLVIILCTMLSACKEVNQGNMGGDAAFSVLILGDSQMAGYGWEGGYANCIEEIYPNAQVVNLAQNGSLLASGDIQAQWDFYLSKTEVMPDFILLDGGINDLPYLRKAEFQETGVTLVSDALRALIEQIHEVSPDTRIIYTLMPPFAEWKDSEEGPPSYDVQEHYWKQLNIVASGYDYVTVLDLFSLNPFSYPSAERYRENLADSIHLNEAGYRKTFEYINNALVPHLEQQTQE